jgi:hypothetical protein
MIRSRSRWKSVLIGQGISLCKRPRESTESAAKGDKFRLSLSSKNFRTSMNYFFLVFAFNTAWAAANLAIGTLKGEQLT